VNGILVTSIWDLDLIEGIKTQLSIAFSSFSAWDLRFRPDRRD